MDVASFISHVIAKQNCIHKTNLILSQIDSLMQDILLSLVH